MYKYIKIKMQASKQTKNRMVIMENEVVELKSKP